MSVLSPNLRNSICGALTIASEQHYGQVTAEHLLLALADDPDAAPVMLACNVDLEKLRSGISSSLSRASENTQIPRIPIRPRPDERFRNIIQRAVRHIRSVQGSTVTGAHVLVQMFADPAAQFLWDQGMGRYDAVSYVSHGIVKRTEAAALDGAASGFNSRAKDDANETRYHVMLLNDMYTPMAFVVQVLQETLPVTREHAIDIMLSTDKDGTGYCGVYDRAQAENFAKLVMERAREHEHPLRCAAVPYKELWAQRVIFKLLKRLDQQVWNAFWSGAVGNTR